MKIRNGKYPNKTDFEPYYGKQTTDSGKFYELPLSDPSESHPTENFREHEADHPDTNKPSAFSENKKIHLKANGTLV